MGNRDNYNNRGDCCYDCGWCFLTFLLIVLDIIFGLCGLATLAVGIVMLAYRNIADQFLGDIIHTQSFFSTGDIVLAVAIIFVVAGSIMFIASIVACGAVGAKDTCAFAFFLTPLVIVMLLHLAIGIAIAIFGGPLLSDGGYMYNALQKDDLYTVSSNSYTTYGSAWNTIQLGYSCCGWNGPQDYATSQFEKNNPTFYVIPSCCYQSPNSTVAKPQARDYPVCSSSALLYQQLPSLQPPYPEVYTTGCRETGIRLPIIIGLAVFFGLAGLELILFSIGTGMACAIGRKYRG